MILTAIADPEPNYGDGYAAALRDLNETILNKLRILGAPPQIHKWPMHTAPQPRTMMDKRADPPNELNEHLAQSHDDPDARGELCTTEEQEEIHRDMHADPHGWGMEPGHTHG